MDSQSPTPGGLQDPSIATLLGEVVTDAQSLVRGELELARAEVRDEIRHARKGLMELTLSGVVMAIGALMLVMMVVQLLAVFGLELWVSYLIVGAVLTGFGYLRFKGAEKRIADIDPVPHETIDSVRKDLKWIRQPTPSDRT